MSDIKYCHITISYFKLQIIIMSGDTISDINPLVHSVHYKGRLTKILILEGIFKNFPMSVATMSR